MAEQIITMDEFAIMVKNAIESKYNGERKVTIRDVNKNNGLVLTGITISMKNCNISPTIYLNQAFTQYQQGCSLENILDDITQMYEDYNVQTNFNVSSITDFSNVKNRICYKLINAEKNKGLLESSPYVLVEDLAIIFYILVTIDRESTGTITVKNNMLKLWDINKDDLYELALTNTQKLFHGVVQSVMDVQMDTFSKSENEDSFKKVYDIMVDEDDVLPMYLCTNHMNLNGAGVILYKGLLREFSEKINSDVFILPSSIHETILVPIYADVEPDYLQQMVKDINYTELRLEDVLSDNIYRYTRATDCITLE